MRVVPAGRKARPVNDPLDGVFCQRLVSKSPDGAPGLEQRHHLFCCGHLLKLNRPDRGRWELRVANRTLRADGHAMAASNAAFFIHQFRYRQLFSLDEYALRAHPGA